MINEHHWLQFYLTALSFNVVYQTIPMLSGIDEVNIKSALKLVTFNSAKLWKGILLWLKSFDSALAFLLGKCVVLKSVIFCNFEHPLMSSLFPRIVLSICKKLNEIQMNKMGLSINLYLNTFPSSLCANSILPLFRQIVHQYDEWVSDIKV